MKKIFRSAISLVLALGLAFGRPVNVNAAGNQSRLNLSAIHAYDRNGNELPYFESSDGGEITYKRNHTKASTGVHYATKYLIMSARPIEEDKTDITNYIPKEYADVGAPFVVVPFTQDQENFDEGFGRIETTYFFNNQELNDVAKKLGITDETDGVEDGMIEIYITLEEIEAYEMLDFGRQ